MPGMKLLLITPYFPPSVQGNAITTGRLARGLEQRGVEVNAFALDRHAPADAASAAREFAPDLIHGFHCYRSAAAVRAVRAVRRIPFVLTATGTDLNHDLFDDERSDAVLAMLREAARVIAFHESMPARVAEVDPRLTGKFVLIKQSVLLEPSARDFRRELGISNDEVVFLLPAGIRPVKNNLFAFSPLASLRSSDLSVRLLLAGPVLDAEYGTRMFAAIKAYEFARYLGEVPHEDMEALYRAANVALNTSVSEGGMCNAVLEALSVGVPVLTSDIAGNRSVVSAGENGFLFNSEADFVEKARRLATDPELRHRLGDAGRERIAREFSFEEEIDEHLRVYQEALDGIT